MTAREKATPPPEKAFPVSWDQFHRDCRALTWRLNEVGPFHAIIAITRGGLVPAAIVARELGIRIIDTVCIASYDHTKQGDLKVLKGVSADVTKLGGGSGKGLLIVDDLVDTGKTGRLVRSMMPDAHFAAVYAKPAGRPLIEAYGLFFIGAGLLGVPALVLCIVLARATRASGDAQPDAR